MANTRRLSDYSKIERPVQIPNIERKMSGNIGPSGDDGCHGVSQFMDNRHT